MKLSPLVGEYERVKGKPGVLAGSFALERYYSLALAAIVLIALALRFFKLGEWSFWIDEIFTLGRALDPQLVVSQYAPTSTILIHTSLHLFGVNEWSARLGPAIAGAFSIPILYLLIRRIIDPTTALISILLLAISPWHIYWSQSVRFYILLMLFYNIALFSFLFWEQTGKKRYLIISLLFLVLAISEKFLVPFLLPIFIVYYGVLLLTTFDKKVNFRWKNSYYLLFTILAIAGIYELRVFNILNVLQEQFFNYSTDPIRLLFSIISDIGLPLFLLGLLGGILLIEQRSRPGLLLLSGAVVPMVLLLLASPFSRVHSRYLFFTLPSWIVLGSFAVKELYTNQQRLVKLLALFVLLILIGDAISQDVLYFGYQNGNRSNWKDAFNLVRQNKMEGDLVYTTWPDMANYYLNTAEAMESEFAKPEEIEGSGQRAWFIFDHSNKKISTDLKAWLAGRVKLMGVFDVYIPGKSMEMRVYLYDP